jgi:MATE family multidrug resistance protein
LDTSIEHPGLRRLPAVRLDVHGRRRVDYRAVIALAAPLFINSAVQAVLSLTDTWFIGRLSVDAMAAMGATFFLVLVFFLLFGGVGLAVQTLAAQNYGAGRYPQAAKAVRTGLYCVLVVTPLFVAVAFLGRALLAPFHLDPGIEQLAVDYWRPRLLGAPFGIAFWAISGFFNGIGRTKVTLAITAVVAVINAVLNELFIFRLGLGIAGSAWATTCALGFGTVAAAWVFLYPGVREKFKCHLMWHFDAKALGRMFALGAPMGLFAAVDLMGFSLFQLMQVKLGPVDGAATQIVMMLTSASFYPGLGIALAGTTLVGQSIGAGDKAWAMRLGTASIKLAVVYMGVVGVALALGGPWLVHWFTAASDANTPAVVDLGVRLLWIAAAYQIFDALNMGSSFCLRGAGDVIAPTVALLFLSWFGFVPLVHMLSFAPGQGWVDFLPHYGYGAVGGWTAAVIYISLLGLMLFWRWRSGVWRQFNVL